MTTAAARNALLLSVTINNVKSRLTLTFIALAVIPVIVYFMSAENSNVSLDLNALRSKVSVSAPAKAIKWETFGTPEFTGFGVPGPTDFITLVAEIELADPTWFAKQSGRAGIDWVAPEASRPWLSDHFRSLLTSSNTDTATHAQCKIHKEVSVGTGKVVEGFICEKNGRLLMHMELLSPSPGIDYDGPPVFE